MQTVTYPPSQIAIERDEDTTFVYRSADGTTPFTGEWACVIKYPVRDPDEWLTLTPDLDDQDGDPPTIRFTLAQADAETITDNLVDGEITAAGVAQHKFRVAVQGP